MLPLKKILCPTDFSEPSYEAIKTANEFAINFSAEIILVHVVTPIPVMPVSPDSMVINLPSYQKELEIYNAKRLQALVEQRVPKSVRVFMHVIWGNPAEEIVRMAETGHVDLIVIATHGLTGWRRFIFGSVAEKVIRIAPCPVLSIQFSIQSPQAANRSY